MERWIDDLLAASFHGSIVILAVILLRLALRKTPKKYICLLWLLAGIRLLLPIELRSDFSLQPEVTIPAAGGSWQRWSAAVPWIWGTVACCFGIYSLISYLKLKNQVRDAVRIRGGWECDRIDTAFILGFIKPRIYIPMGMDTPSRRHILAHERTHLDKGDHWIKMIGFLALSVHWFNPLVWIAYILLCRDIEMACDERVVQFMELDERKSYSAALLSCSSKKARLSSPVAFGEVSVKQRILSVLNYKKPSFWFCLLGVLAVFFVAICLVTSPAAQSPAAEAFTPEAQAEKAQLRKYHDELEAVLSGEEFHYDVFGCDDRGSVLWKVQLYRQGSNTMWKYRPSTSPSEEAADGRMEWKGQHYAYQSGSWVQTDAQDTRFEDWVDLFRWDLESAELLEETDSKAVLTSKWMGEDNTVHTATVTYYYSGADELRCVDIENPNYPNTDRVDLDIIIPVVPQLETPKTVSEIFTEAEADIVQGIVTSEELSLQAEFNDWGIFFRVDDDRLSSVGSDIILSQAETGRGIISTSERYWIEKMVDGKWEAVPTAHDPKWDGSDNVGVAKGTSTFDYLDWTPIYGRLEPGEYRMGKTFRCIDQETGYSKLHDFYAEFSIMQSVDPSSPEAAAAVERCYAAVEELKSRDHIHFLSNMGWIEETWINNGNYLRIRTFGEDSDLPENNGRVDIAARWDGVGYIQVREDPEVRGSKILGMKLSTLSANRAGWNMSFAESLGVSFYERSNKTATFPEGIGVISDEMVRFVITWPVAGLDVSEASAQLTYRFDAEGKLTYMEYVTTWQEPSNTYYIQVFDTSAGEIDAKILPYTQDLIVDSFSWEEAQAKYTEDAFNIRETGFVNNGGNPITGPADAAELALKEYPDLGVYLSLDIFRDDSAGMWKVTIESYVDYQATYAYRDVYLTDTGATRLLVYEGPLRFDEERK